VCTEVSARLAASFFTVLCIIASYTASHAGILDMSACQSIRMQQTGNYRLYTRHNYVQTPTTADTTCEAFLRTSSAQLAKHCTLRGGPKTFQNEISTGKHTRFKHNTFVVILPGVNECGICGRQSDTGAGSLRVLRFPMPICIPRIAPQSSFNIWGWYKGPNSGRSTKRAQSHPTNKKNPAIFETLKERRQNARKCYATRTLPLLFTLSATALLPKCEQCSVMK
jgi:hypothetical protein